MTLAKTLKNFLDLKKYELNEKTSEKSKGSFNSLKSLLNILNNKIISNSKQKYAEGNSFKLDKSFFNYYKFEKNKGKEG